MVVVPRRERDAILRCGVRSAARRATVARLPAPTSARSPRQGSAPTSYTV